jgi:hypothetical protein
MFDWRLIAARWVALLKQTVRPGSQLAQLGT